MNNSRSPEEREQRSQNSIIRKIMLLFFLLVATITFNSIFNYVRVNKDTWQEVSTRMSGQLDSAVSVIDYEKDLQNTVSRIVLEQRGILMDFLDFEKYRPIQIMMQTVAVNHSVDRIFFLDEYQELLLTNQQSYEQIDERESYQQLARQANEGTQLAYVPRAYLADLLPTDIQSPEVLCLKTTIPLIHDLGDIYGYVVLVNIIEGDSYLRQRIGAMSDTSFVIYDKYRNPVLSNLDIDLVGYPNFDSNLVSTDRGEFYSRVIDLNQGADVADMGLNQQNVAELAILIDRRLILKEQQRQLINNLVPFLAAIIVSFALFIFLKRKVLNRILHLTNTLFAVSSDRINLTTRLMLPNQEKNKFDELDQTYKGFNNMMDQLQDSYEQLEVARSDAEAANVAKSNFLANMSHEIRTPMNAVIGLTYLALNTELDIKQRGYLKNINVSANALLGIINDILDFSKIEAGQLDIENISFPLCDVLDNLANIASVSTEDKDVEVLFDISRDTPEWLKGDPLRLGQILINLTNNAIKFTERGEVVVSSSLIQNNGEQVTLQFTVTDTGIGMTAEQQDKLFQAFSQADTSTTRKFGGTGLGLSICKRLVEMMGGEIEVHSQIGIGSEFSFTITLDCQEPIKEQEVESFDMIKGLRVLLVDDNSVARTIMGDMLLNLGATVSTVGSGWEAVAVTKKAIKKYKEPFDLIIMDWSMPDMDGVETARSIRLIEEIATPPKFLLNTAYGNEDVRRQAENADLDGFLTKPVTPHILSKAICQVLSKTGGDAAPEKIFDSSNFDLRGKYLLLAEDNLLNQRITSEILESAGVIIDVVENGDQAVQRVKRSPNKFDAVLMDVMMPVMDGLEATRIIRADLSMAELPIIAMTASVMQKDLDACIDSGMNDIVPKPINVEHLFGILQKWISSHDSTDPMESSGVQESHNSEDPLPDSLDGINVQGALKRLGCKKELYYKMLFKCGEDCLKNSALLRQALGSKDWGKVHKLAHELKGVASNFGIDAVCDIAEKIEIDSSEGKTEGLADLFDELQQEMDVVLKSLERIKPV